MTESYKRVIANLILDYFFAHEAVALTNSTEVTDYVTERVRANVSAERLISTINGVAQDLRSAGVLEVGNTYLTCIPSYYSASRDTWQHLDMMDTTHINNALQKLLREGEIIRRRTEARWLIIELSRRAMSNG
jgi:hypothetical protein